MTPAQVKDIINGKTRVWCSASEEEARSVLHTAHKYTSLNVTNRKWDPRRKKMCILLKGGTIGRQTQIVQHAEIDYCHMLPKEMENFIRTSYKRPQEERKEFDPGKCKYDEADMVWITDQETKKRVPLNAKLQPVYIKSHQGKNGPVVAHRILAYTLHNYEYPEPCKRISKYRK